jgi:hypothetical protein
MKGDFSRLIFQNIKHFAAVLSQQGRVLLDSEQNEQEVIETYLRETSLTDIIGPSGVPLGDPHAFEISAVAGSNFTIGDGRMYVDGILVENDQPVSFTAQPYLPADGETISAPGGVATRTDAVYLEVWQQHVTALEDPDIREKALNIPDTTTRLRTLWRVHIQQGVGNVDCDDPIAGFPPPSTAIRLTNSVNLAAQPEDPCVIAPDGGFRLLENRLLRVEIHSGSGAPGSPTAKWSAENGAVVYGISSLSPITIMVGGSSKAGLRLTLKQQARDQFLSLGVNDLVEIVSGADEIRGRPGVLATVHARISATVYDVLPNPGETVPAAYTATPLPASLYDPSLTDFKVRRWDGLIPDLTAAADLGNTGVSVTFPTVGFARSGDFWVFAGRTANVASAADSIEKLTAAPPQGVQRHYARLALIRWNGSAATLVDCRSKFPPLTNMIELHYVSGDGQEARPGQPIKPLVVRVSNGGIPLANCEVNFVAAAASGTVTPLAPAPPSLPMRTDSHGLASVNWTLNPNTYRQQVTASLVANPDLQVVFNANLSVAQEVAYTPKDPKCFDPAVDNVQDALDQLCARGGEPDEDGIRIKEVLWTLDKSPAKNNSHVPLSRLLAGLLVTTDQIIAPTSISRATCYMMIEAPMEAADPTSWFFPVVIRAAEGTDGGQVITWTPISLPASMVRLLSGLNAKDRDLGLLARFYLKGNFIQNDKSELYLDGDDFGVRDGSAPFNLLPLDSSYISGNKRRGGDFYMWFWVVPDQVLPDFRRIGFMARRLGIARDIFIQDFEPLFALYESILDRSINRSALGPNLFPDQPNYQPLPTPFELTKAQEQWKATILTRAAKISKGTVLVFFPQSLQDLGETLCRMWSAIEPNLKYRPMPVIDGEFVPELVDRMNAEQNAGSGFSLVIIGEESVAQEVTARYPQDFDMQDFKPI